MVDDFHILASATAHPQELLSPDVDSYQPSQFLDTENTLDILAALSISAADASQGALGTPLRLSVLVSLDNL